MQRRKKPEHFWKSNIVEKMRDTFDRCAFLIISIPRIWFFFSENMTNANDINEFFSVLLAFFLLWMYFCFLVIATSLYLDTVQMKDKFHSVLYTHKHTWEHIRDWMATLEFLVAFQNDGIVFKVDVTKISTVG